MWKIAMLVLRLRNELRFAWALLRDPRSPLAAKAAVVAAAVYVISPFDLIPDWIPVLGWLDDALISALLLKLAAHLLPQPLRDALRAEVERRAAARH
jgi:uncharacterized membrane protein YkvA (DUF1232 family)